MPLRNPGNGVDSPTEGVTEGNGKRRVAPEWGRPDNAHGSVPRVVVTGMGVIAPTGAGKQKYWDALVEGRSFIGQVTRFDAATYPSRIAGEVSDEVYSPLVDLKRLRRMPLISRFAVAATRLALADARLDARWAEPYRVGVVLGTSLGAYKEGSEQTVILHERGISRVNPFLALSSYNHSTAGEVAIESGAQGPNLTATVGCPSSLCAVGLAADLIRQGRLDVCITGGSEAPIFPVVFAAMCQAHELSTLNECPSYASRPFDKSHSGIVVSEGSCILILESEEHACGRGARRYAHIEGYAVGSEAHEMYGIEPTGDSAVRTLKLALRDAGCAPEEIGYVSAHGNSCPRWDRKETFILKKAFGDLAYQIPASSIKGAIGHNFGAAGAFQIASIALAFQANLLPPTANLEEPDPECDLDYIHGDARQKRVDVCLISNFGYGGVNAFMVLRRASGDR
jgi:3-oxoacyl-[acyl-carrier-protein] synthase II